MPYIIDGHNLIGKLPGLHLSDVEDEQKLVELLEDYCQRRGQKVMEVYFDNAAPGQSGAKKYARLNVRFVRAGLTADAAITNHLQRLGNAAANWIVVSSDREVQTAARRARARIQSSEDFSRELLAAPSGPDKTEDPRMSADDVDDWMKLFGGEKNG
ncbi:MAG: hypothetical protein EPO32_07585 [Anaerolineae bacterium]|nr:MAG: hypothetical protein EPO32_07585 [Anaerolineae bacterium]